MMCAAAKDPNIFLKSGSIGGGPSQLEAMELATLARQCVDRHLWENTK